MCLLLCPVIKKFSTGQIMYILYITAFRNASTIVENYFSNKKRSHLYTKSLPRLIQKEAFEFLQFLLPQQ